MVSSPTAVTLIRTEESVAIVPATTRSPALRVTGLDSPVIIDSSKAASPSTIVPSAGTRLPERTSTRSPTRNASIGTSSTPASVRRSAVSGRSVARASSALVAWPSDRISIQ